MAATDLFMYEAAILQEEYYPSESTEALVSDTLMLHKSILETIFWLSNVGLQPTSIETKLEKLDPSWHEKLSVSSEPLIIGPIVFFHLNQCFFCHRVLRLFPVD